MRSFSFFSSTPVPECASKLISSFCLSYDTLFSALPCSFIPPPFSVTSLPSGQSRLSLSGTPLLRGESMQINHIEMLAEKVQLRVSSKTPPRFDIVKRTKEL